MRPDQLADRRPRQHLPQLMKLPLAGQEPTTQNPTAIYGGESLNRRIIIGPKLFRMNRLCLEDSNMNGPTLDEIMVALHPL